VEPDVFGDQRQAEPDTVDVHAAPGAGAAVEPVEDRLAVLDRHAGALVLDRDQHVVTVLPQLDPGGPVAVLGGIVEQIGDHPHQAPLVGPDHDARQVGVDVDGDVGVGRHGDRLDDELGEPHLLEVEVHHAGVEARDLEQVLDEVTEAVDVGNHQVECGLGAFGHVVALVLEHLDRRRQRHER
jgi:hypothetical protein